MNESSDEARITRRNIPIEGNSHLAQSEIPLATELKFNSMPTGMQLETSSRDVENEDRILPIILSVKYFTAYVYLGASKYHTQGISIIQCSASYVRLPLKRYQRSVQSLAKQNGTKIPLRYVEDVSTRCKTWYYTCANTHCEPKLCLYIIL